MIIITKKSPDPGAVNPPVHFYIDADMDASVRTFCQDDDEGKLAVNGIVLTSVGWQELRNRTPEAIALKELTEALDKRLAHCIGHDKPGTPTFGLGSFLSGDNDVVSALQEARVLVRRMK